MVGKSALGLKPGNTQCSSRICNGYEFNLKWIWFWNSIKDKEGWLSLNWDQNRKYTEQLILVQQYMWWICFWSEMDMNWICLWCSIHEVDGWLSLNREYKQEIHRAAYFDTTVCVMDINWIWNGYELDMYLI